MFKAKSKKNSLVVIFISILLFLITFYLYNPVYNKIANFIGGVDIVTQNIGSKFIRNIFFALNIGVTPVFSLIIANRIKLIKLKYQINSSIIIFLFGILGGVIRLINIRNSIDMDSKPAITIETIKLEEFMFLGIVIGCLFVYIYLNKKISGT